jgi:hypothetical protein
MFNITRLWKFYERCPTLFDHVEVTITPAVVDIMTKYRDLDPFRLSEMTAAEVDDPHNVAMAVYVRGAFEPIDGNHLIMKRIMLGRDTFRCVMLPERLIPRFLIHWEVHERGRWREITPDELMMALDGVYGQPDGSIVDASGTVLDRVRPPPAQPKSPFG